MVVNFSRLKRFFWIFFLLFSAGRLSAQQVDSIYFNLYTDSLKKGTFNYINVEGKYSDGHYLPLGEKEVLFTSSGGTFSGNSLFIDTNFTADRVKVKAVLRSRPAMWKETVIYVKRRGDNERLPTEQEILGRPARRKSG